MEKRALKGRFPYVHMLGVDFVVQGSERKKKKRKRKEEEKSQKVFPSGKNGGENGGPPFFPPFIHRETVHPFRLTVS